jgi:hypothetical protein
MGFVMINEILWYIWIVGRAYLQVGLLIGIIFWAISFSSNGVEKLTLKDFIFTVLLHPIVVYYFIKEYEGRN